MIAILGLSLTSCSEEGSQDLETIPAAPSDTVSPDTSIASTTTARPSLSVPSLKTEIRDDSGNQVDLEMFGDGSYHLSYGRPSSKASIRTDRSTGISEITDGSLPVIVRNDLPLAGPDAYGFFVSYYAEVEADLAASIDGARLGGGGTAQSVGGRPATRASSELKIAGQAPLLIAGTIDNETGILLDSTLTQGSIVERRVASTPTFTNGNPSIRTALSKPALPSASNYRVVSPGSLPGLPYQTLEPRLPTGYQKQFVQSAIGRTGSTVGRGVGDNEFDSNPESSNVYIAAYRSGFREVVLTMRDANPLRLPVAPTWGDPYDRGLERIVEIYTPKSGALAGTPFTIVRGLGTTPHAWGIANGQVITIGGPLSAAQLREAIEGLN